LWMVLVGKASTLAASANDEDDDDVGDLSWFFFGFFVIADDFVMVASRGWIGCVSVHNVVSSSTSLNASLAFTFCSTKTSLFFASDDTLMISSALRKNREEQVVVEVMEGVDDNDAAFALSGLRRRACSCCSKRWPLAIFQSATVTINDT